MALLVGLAGAIGPAAAAVYHVAPAGQDSSPGTEAQPWRTLARAAAAVQPGDTVRIRAGTYVERGGWNVTRAGTAERPITYQAAGDGEVRITPSWEIPAGSWKHVQGSIYSAPVSPRPAYLFHNALPVHPPGERARIHAVADMFPNTFHVEGTTLYVWLRDGADPNHAVMRAAASHAVNLRECHHTIFDGLTVEFSYNGFKDQGRSTHHVTYRNCTIRSIGSQGIQPVPQHAVIEGNLFQKIGVNKFTHGIYSSKPGLIVRQNVFEEITGAGIHQYHEGDPAGGHCQFYGNTFRRPRQGTERPAPGGVARPASYYVDIIAWGDGNNQIFDNLFEGEGKRGGISLNSRENHVTRNTFIGSAYAVSFHPNQPRNRVTHNIVIDATRSFVVWPAKSLPQMLDDNVYFNSSAPARWEHDSVAHQAFASYQTVARETHSSTAPPRRAAAWVPPPSSPVRDPGPAAALPAPFEPVIRPQPASGGLFAAMQRRGYDFRQHGEEVGWTQRKVNVSDLDARQRGALEREGVAGLKRVVDDQGIWSFPAMDIQRPLPVQRHVVLAEGGVVSAVVVAPGAGTLREMAEEFVKAVVAQARIDLPLLDDAVADLALLKGQHVVLFGGSHESRWARDFSLRYQSGFVDGVVPGDDGWVVTTHAGLDRFGHNVTQVTATAGSRAEAAACLQAALAVEDDRVVLRATHRVHPGATMRTHFPGWDAWAARVADLRLPAENSSVRSLTPLEVAERVAPGTPGGSRPPHDAAPIYLAIQSAQFYQRSGDPRALELFRELLFRVADYYLKRPAGAFYPADFDFPFGRALLYYARLEHEPVFSDDDRLILANLLLSCTRSIYEYTMKLWALQPGVVTLHNHETFAARSLMYAVDYFDRYGVPHTAAWRKRVDDVFRGEVWNRSKQRENANNYEAYAYDHAASYSAFLGRRLDLFDRETLRQAARRHLITADNLLRPVDYGDTGLSLLPGRNEKLAVLYGALHDDPALQWFAHAAFERQRNYLPGATDAFTDLRRPWRGAVPATGGWELLPLDAKFTATEAPGFPAEFAFDKLALRSGWEDDAHYLLFEGVGNQKVSHSHNNVNGIVRLNHLGRLLLVSNGYGRTVADPESFGGRVRGPEDHNNLVLTSGGKIVRDLPVCSALLQRGQSGPLAYATGALLGYSGLDWYRTVLILPDRFILALDRIRVGAASVDAGHIEWNCPGEVTAQALGFRVAQQGVFLDVASASGWTAHQGVSDRSNDWKRALQSGAYPFAKWPLKKLIFQLPGTAAGRTESLATLLAATRSAEPDYRISEPARGVVRIEARAGGLPVIEFQDGDLAVRGGGAALEIRFAPVPPLPANLRPLAAR